jgi:phosphoribosylformylglycinamidine cyclo-ligase
VCREKSQVIDGRGVVAGDVLIGLPSAGLHTNGYSLARRVLFDAAGYDVHSVVPELGATVGEALLAPHRSYLRAMQPLVSDNLVKGMAHITGGGITENLPRTLPQGCSARVDRGAWSVPPLFAFLQKRGAIGTDEMFRTFNMGIGLVAICSAGDAENVIGRLERSGEQPVRLGQVISGDRDVRYA